MADVNVKLVFDGLKTAQKGLDSLRSGVNSVGNALFSMQSAVIAAIGAFSFKEIIQAANTQEDAVNRLNTALKTSGEFSEAASQDMQKFASQIQETTRFGDELVLNQLALAKSFGASNDQAQKIVEAATNLSAAMGIDLESATRNVAKTLGGFAGELGETIPALKNLTKEQLQAGEGIKLLGERFAGFAQRDLQTFSGALDQSKNSFGDLLEQIGFIITKSKVSVAFINGLSKSFQFLGKIVEENREFLQSLVISGINIVLDGAASLAKSFGGLIIIFGQIREVGNRASIVFDRLAIGFLNLKKGINTAQAAVKDFFGDDQITKTVERQNKAIEDQIDIIKQGIDIEAVAIDERIKESEKFATQIVSNANKAIRTIRDEVNKAGEGFAADPPEIPVTAKFQEPTEPLSVQATLALKIGNEISSIITNTFAGSFSSVKESFENIFNEISNSKEVGNIASSLVGSIQKGSAGATQLVSGLASTFGQAFLGPVGSALGPAIELLSQSPEQLKEQINGFVDAFPTLITSIIDNIPVLIESFLVSLIKAIPKLIDALISAIPRLIRGLIDAIPSIINAFIELTPLIAVQFSIELVRQMPYIVGNMVSSLSDGIANIFVGLYNWFAGLLNSIFGGIGDFFGFADGGMVPKGYPNDTFPARLSSGEMVIDRSTTDQLKRALNDGGIGQSQNTDMLLARLIQAVEQPQTIETSVEFNQQTLANILINLNRTGTRVA